MELWNLETNRYECKFYMAILKNIKTFFLETQFPPFGSPLTMSVSFW